MYTKIYTTYGLVLLYLFINIYYHKCYNIILFLGVFLISLNILNNLEKAVIISYVVSIIFGIWKNFHLLENFNNNSNDESSNKLVNNSKNSNNKNEIDIINDKDIQRLNKIESNNLSKLNDKDLEDIKEIKELVPKGTNTKYSKNFNNSLNTDSNNIENLITEGLIIKFMEKLRKENINMLFTKRVDLLQLKPIKSNIASGKIKQMRNSIENYNLDFMNIPIIVSNDNFIVDGHHKWFTRKYYINSDTNIGNINNKYINVRVIDMDIKTLINRLREFKNIYNKNLILDYKIDIKKMNKLKQNIESIRTNLNDLEEFHNQIKKIKVV